MTTHKFKGSSFPIVYDKFLRPDVKCTRVQNSETVLTNLHHVRVSTASPIKLMSQNTELCLGMLLIGEKTTEV